jgi:predicted Zn-dependent protease
LISACHQGQITAKKRLDGEHHTTTRGSVLMARRTILALVMACSTAALAGCSSSHTSSLLAHEKKSFHTALAQKIGASPTEVSRALDDSAANEIRTAREITARMEDRIGLSDDVRMQEHLQQMAEKLAGPMKDINGGIEVVLLADSDVNAFTPGGGKILIKEGLLSLCDSEGEMAAVLAHELAHIGMRHPRKLKQVSLARRAGDRFVNSILPKALQNGAAENFLRNAGRASLNIFVRNQEYQADAIGIDLMVKAGYDPRSMVSLQRHLQIRVKQMPRFVNIVNGNHPLSEDRAAEAQKRIDRYYSDVSGIVTSSAYDKLAKKYIDRRARVLAQR